MEKNLAVAVRAHGMGVEDAKLALRLVLENTHMLSDQRLLVLRMLDNLVVLPTRVIKEVVDADLER